MEYATLLKKHKFDKLIQWFILCDQRPDDSFTALANILDITPHALIQILKLTHTKKIGDNLEYYLLNDELDMSTQYRYAHTINQLLEPGRLMHGVLTYLNPNKWMCFMQTLHDVVHDPDPSSFGLDYAKYVDCVSRVSEETTPPPNRGMVVEEHENDERDDIGLGIAPPTTMSPNEIARERVKAEIKELIRTMLTTPIPPPQLFRTHDQVLEQMITASIAELERKINAYLKDKTINRKVVKNLHGFYSRMFVRTDERIDEDMHWLDDHTPAQKYKIRIENSILDALAKLGKIKTGGKKSRSKKRGRKSVHRRKKSIHKKRRMK